MLIIRAIGNLVSLPIRGINGLMDKFKDTSVGVHTIVIMPLAMVRAMDERCLKAISKP